MAFPSAIVPLNLLVELLSECADLTDFAALLRVAGGRIRWILGFERCTLVLVRGEQRRYWTVTQTTDRLTEIVADAVPPEQALLLTRAVARGTPESHGLPCRALCAPLVSVDGVLGAICFSSAGEPYHYRDTRLVYHIAQCISSTVMRLDLVAKAQESARRKDEFLALLSHELRNPLAPILTAVHLLKLGDGGVAGAREVAIIERQAWHLMRLVDDLLGVSRSQRDQVVLHTEPIEVAQIVARAVELAGPLIEQYQHCLTLEVPSKGLIVAADVDRLPQLLVNLLSNAARYTNAGGRITLAARRDGDDVVIEVGDDGIGIAPELLPRIFDPFVRAPGAIDRAQGGLGLGLSIVKTLTELHGGSVRAVSAGLGLGAKFSLRLPALPDDAVLQRPQAIRPRLVLADPARRILLVDDNEDAAEMLAKILSDAGHEVVVAHDGPEALATAARFVPSIAVLDIGLPVMDGYELAGRLKDQLGAAAPYLIALTGYGEAGDRIRSRAAGFAHHFVKPVNADVLLQSIGAVPSSAAPR